ncbi:hypothetical protein EG329_003245 [Mollisiaceae sp. DMI_Dod_QoI]|nr:hypothetical protein EG329_003245 [Helotiales sp. DMI_Dod_QoI]
MAAPAFGFSVGNFISAISLIKTLVTALNDAAGSKRQYQRLIEALLNLERALTEVKVLKVTTSQASQKIALEQVASQSQQSIERFLEENAKFKPTLALVASSSKWSLRTLLHKIQWALCKEEAVARLRAEITGHTLTINTLLATIQLSTTCIQEEAAKNYEIAARDHRSLSGGTNSIVRKNSDLLNTQVDLILSISREITKCSTRNQSVNLQSIMLKVLDTNMKIYSIVLNMQELQQNMPPQIDRQQPVIFDDAHGRIAPFHVEFINSFEAFQAVMEVRFRHVPGLKKVQKKEYRVEESLSHRMVNLRSTWESVFLPGRKFNMRKEDVEDEIQHFRRVKVIASSMTSSTTELPAANKKSRINTPWAPAEEQRLKHMRDAGNSWTAISKVALKRSAETNKAKQVQNFPSRTEGSIKKHWYMDMHYAEFAEDEAEALLKEIGRMVGKPANACAAYAKEHFAGKI